jgi:hypothetical protein
MTSPLAVDSCAARSPLSDCHQQVLDEEVDYILDMGIHTHFETYVDSLKSVLDKGYDAVFVGTGAPSGSDLDLPGREDVSKHIHVGIEWLGSVAFDHIQKWESACWCWVAATPPWTAAERPAGLVERTSKWWCAPSLQK